MYENPWYYKGEPFDGPINGYEGFVYIITNITNNKKYIGKKHFWSRVKLKGKTRKTTLESTWRQYYGSCDPLIEDTKLLGKEKFKREILYLCVYKKEMSFLEEHEQWINNVLLSDDWYNTNIAGKYFVRERKIYFSEFREKEITQKNDKWREIKAEQMKGDNNIAKREDVRKKISDKKKGEKHHQFGKPISEDHKYKLHTAANEARKMPIIDENGNEYESASEYRKQTGIYVTKFYKLIEKGVIRYKNSG